MSERNFRQMLEAQWAKGNFVCVGLDSNVDEVLKRFNKGDYLETMCAFNRDRIEATGDLVCAFKINTAFYENRGSTGWVVLEQTVKDIHNLALNVPVILDFKKGDPIKGVNAEFAYMAFEFLKVDAITVNPYPGAEALQPFLARADKGIIVLCRTSNPGAGEFQNLRASDGCKLMPLYEHVAHNVARNWNKNNNCALVVGATYPWELRQVRKIVGDMPILFTGIGFQQKNVPLEEQVKQAVNAGKDSHGQGMIINSSRVIIFSDDPRRETVKLRDLVNQYR